MKQKITGILIILKAIVTFIIVIIDRFTMSLFIGIELPPIKNKAIKIDENTTDEQIHKSEIDDNNHEIMYRDVYLPKARKRTKNVIITAISIYLFNILSWTILLLITSAIAVSIGIGILVIRIKQKANKAKDEPRSN